MGHFCSSLKSKCLSELSLSDLLVAAFADIRQKAGKTKTDIRNYRKLEHSCVC